MVTTAEDLVSAGASWGVPRWTQRMYVSSGGLDHLGLASVVQDRLLPVLSPGVNVVTVHPRYWSFFTFVIDEFWQRDGPRTTRALNAFLRERESIYGTACLLCSNHGTDIRQVVGYNKLSHRVGQQPVDVETRFDYIKAPAGGYGQYASALVDLGLIQPAGSIQGLRCDTVTPRGRELAAAFREGVRTTRYYREFFHEDDTSVPLKVVQQYGNKACLCRLPQGAERELLVDAFLHGHALDQDASESEARRATLRMMCDLSQQSRSSEIGAWTFRSLIYFRGSDGLKYLPNDALVETARRWRLYQLREWFAFALNNMLRRVVGWGLDRDGAETPIPIDDVLAIVDTADFAALANHFGTADPRLGPTSTFTDLLRWIGKIANVVPDLDAAWDYDVPVQEDKLVNWLWEDPDLPASTAGLLTLLGVVAARLWPREMALRYQADWWMVRAGGLRRVGLAHFLQHVRLMDRSDATIGDVGRSVLDRFVLRQHHRVAMAKLPSTGDTFRLRLEGRNVWFFHQTLENVIPDSRFTALSTCTAELGWTGPFNEAPRQLSPEGKRFIRDGDLPSVSAVAAEDPVTT